MSSILQLLQDKHIKHDFFDDSRSEVVLEINWHKMPPLLIADGWKLVERRVDSSLVHSALIGVFARGPVRIKLYSAGVHKCMIWKA
jgi:hypothetical protein